MSRACSRRVGILGAALLAGCALHAGAVSAGTRGAAPANAAIGARCDGAIRHPLQVRVTALDPVRHGEVVRLRVAVTPHDDWARGEVRMISAGGATLESPPAAWLGRLASGLEVARDFAVRVPAQGPRFLLQFRVSGEGNGGVAHRGATFNLLPQGPQSVGRVVAGSSGAVVEHRARRIER